MTIPKIKHFARGDRVYVQAQQIWLILTAYVHYGPRRSRPTTITYGELALEMGFEDTRAGYTLARQLGIVGHYCVYNGLPALNAIVVNQDTKMPGDEVVLRANRSVHEEQKAVMKQNWFGLRVPTTGTFRRVWEHDWSK